MKFKLIMTLFLAVSSIVSINASELPSEDLQLKISGCSVIKEQVEVKYYVDQQNLHIHEDEILLFLENECVTLTKLRVDKNGLYFMIKDIKADCFNRHPTWCERCRGCSFFFCPGRCRCFG
ncbi:MAG: hypothetical protein KDK62_06275 [Chlamydiia bacterium]|nr:hypothetical protein [Chlamydiia bacterium]